MVTEHASKRLLNTVSAFLPHAKCPFLWVDGTNDFAFRLDNVRRSADLVPSKSAFATITRMVHSHGFYGENPPEIVQNRLAMVPRKNPKSDPRKHPMTPAREHLNCFALNAGTT